MSTCIKLVDKKSWQSTCIKPVDNLQQTCYHQAGASDANASWYRLDDCKVTSLQQTCLQFARFLLCNPKVTCSNSAMADHKHWFPQTKQTKTLKLKKVLEILQHHLVINSWYQDAFAWQQVCCKLSTDLLQVDCKNLLSTGLLQVVSTSCNKSVNVKLRQAKLVVTWWNWQVYWNLLTSCYNAIKVTTCNKSVTFCAILHIVNM